MVNRRPVRPERNSDKKEMILNNESLAREQPT
jgi:hypothetical protein